jgi:hypothetical protein
MAIIASNTGGGGDFSPTPQGTHLAICNMVVDLGKQRGEYQGVPNVKHKVFIRWELPHERLTWTDRDGVEREGPRVVSKTYTVSLHENSALRADLVGWRGRDFTPEEEVAFDIANLLGKPCMLTVVHKTSNGKTFANVQSVSGVPKGMEKPTECENTPLLYDNDNPSSWDRIPEWLQKKIDEQVRDEPAPKNGHGGAWDDDLDDDCPF